MKSSVQSSFGLPVKQIPSSFIGRLAVDKNFKGKGYGALTLVEALKQIRGVSKITGIRLKTASHIQK